MSTPAARLLVVTEVRGALEPCGCTSHPLGGLDRLARVVTTQASSVGGRALLLVAGDTVHDASTVAERERPQRLAKARAIAGIFGRLGAVVAPGPYDHGLGFGVETWQAAGCQVAGGIRGVGAQRVAVLGAAFEAEALAPRVAAARAAGATLVVALSPLGFSEGLELARGVPELDVVVSSGDPADPPRAPRQVGSTTVVEAGTGAQRVAVLDFHGDPAQRGRVLYDPERRRAELAARADALTREVEHFTRLAGPQAAASRRAALAGVQRELAAYQSPPPPAGPFVRTALVELDHDVSAEPGARAAIDAYVAEARSLNRAADAERVCPPAPAAQPVYIGTDACRECHVQAYRFWQSTKHAAAWQTLTDRGQDYDYECVRCHSVGYEDPRGFCRITDGVARSLQDVGCEACHGPGSAHRDAPGPAQAPFVLAPAEAECRACHVPDHSDLFDYGVYAPAVLGRGHGE